MQPLLDVAGLRVTARKAGEEVPIVQEVSFSLHKGEVLALIGESGSGKTTIALSLLGYAKPGCRIAGGRIRLGETEVLDLPVAGLRSLRGRRVAYVAQSATAAFNPARRIMEQVVESALIHGVMDRRAAEAEAVALFRALALPEPERIGARYPHQVSGGQLQRLMAAMALITSPDLVILDEPTTALDVTTQIEVLRAFKAVVRERGVTAVYVSHDLAVVAQIADRIIVLRGGRMQEEGQTGQILSRPTHPYTQDLLAAAAPAIRDAAPLPAEREAPVLEVRGLVAGYGALRGGLPQVPVLQDIGLSIRRGASLGIIGESGSGKSTLARVIGGLLPLARGEMLLNGQRLPPSVQQRSPDQLRRVQLVFQSADTALNPARTVRRILGRPLTFFRGLRGAALEAELRRLLDLVHLPAATLDRLPGQLSGGQKQRVNLARALAAQPDLILCDEVTSALDTVVGAAILGLMDELRRELGLATLFISHDLHMVRAVCDEVMVLYAGRQMETGSRVAMAEAPWHPYSELLIASVPELQPGWLEAVGEVRAPEMAPGAARPACPFFPRCGQRIDGVCDREPLPARELSKGSRILCHRTEPELREMLPARPHDSAALVGAR